MYVGVSLITLSQLSLPLGEMCHTRGPKLALAHSLCLVPVSRSHAWAVLSVIHLNLPADWIWGFRSGVCFRTGSDLDGSFGFSWYDSIYKDGRMQAARGGYTSGARG